MPGTGYWIAQSGSIEPRAKPLTSEISKRGLIRYSPPCGKITAEGKLELATKDLYLILSTGFFQVTVPDSLNDNVKEILNFLTTFHRKPEFTHGFNATHADVTKVPIQGFMIDNEKPLPGQTVAQQNNQVWRLNLKNGPDVQFWQYFPPNLQQALDELKKFKIRVLHALLQQIGIEPRLFAQLTCNVTEGKGDEYALFNAYPVGVNASTGLREHYDYGIITALLSPVYVTEADAIHDSGLEVYITANKYINASGWYSVVPDINSIIFNFGSAFAKAMQKFDIHLSGELPVKLHAALHRVPLSPTQRFSFANFGDPPFVSDIYTLTPDGKNLEKLQSYSQHCTQENQRLYG